MNTDKNKPNNYTLPKPTKKTPMVEVIKDTLYFIVTSPTKAIGTFLFWLILVFSVLGISQAIYYDSIYCKGNIEGLNGRYMLVYNDFISHLNERIENNNEYYASFNKSELLLDDLNITYGCKYNISHWKNKDYTSFRYNLKLMFYERWVKNTN